MISFTVILSNKEHIRSSKFDIYLSFCYVLLVIHYLVSYLECVSSMTIGMYLKLVHYVHNLLSGTAFKCIFYIHDNAYCLYDKYQIWCLKFLVKLFE